MSSTSAMLFTYLKEQWFSNFAAHRNHLLKTLMPGTPLPEILNKFGIGCDLGIRMFYSSIDDFNVASVFEMI